MVIPNTKECFKDEGKEIPFVNRLCKSRHTGYVFFNDKNKQSKPSLLLTCENVI